MNHPLHHVGQTASPQEDAATPDDQAGDAGAEARQKNPADEADRSSLQHPEDPDSSAPREQSSARKPAAPGPGSAPGGKPIDDLKPGEPPPESSAGS